jgi:hypothetical protein
MKKSTVICPFLEGQACKQGNCGIYNTRCNSCSIPLLATNIWIHSEAIKALNTKD